MPIYEYECTQCGTVVDIRHGFKEAASEPCAQCGAALKRVFRPAGIVFKGSGFYVTDSRKPSAGLAASQGSPAKTETKSEQKTETKSEPKTETKSPTGEAAA